MSRIKIATWNVNSLKVRLPQVLEWLAAQQPDVLALQETKTEDANFPQQAIVDAGYQVIFSGQKTYNGVALISRTVATDPVTDLPQLTDPQRRVLAATINGVRVVNLYVPNGESVDSEKYKYKLNWFAALKAYLQAELQRHPKVVVVGDFNVAPEDRDVHDPAAWAGSVLVSAPERAALQAVLSDGLEDVFRRFEQPEKAYSWWDYRQMAFRRNRGLRIDLILASAAMAKACLSCTIDKEPRRAERPSDHTPVVAEFDI
jgi:exodeoxyribonuclease-3